jgi:hypothetical protein
MPDGKTAIAQSDDDAPVSYTDARDATALGAAGDWKFPYPWITNAERVKTFYDDKSLFFTLKLRIFPLATGFSLIWPKHPRLKCRNWIVSAFDVRLSAHAA